MDIVTKFLYRNKYIQVYINAFIPNEQARGDDGKEKTWRYEDETLKGTRLR